MGDVSEGFGAEGVTEEMVEKGKEGKDGRRVRREWEQRKARRKLRRQRRQEERRVREEALEEKRGVVGEEVLEEEVVVYEFQEDEDLKRVFGEACMRFVGLDHYEKEEGEETGRERAGSEGDDYASEGFCVEGRPKMEMDSDAVQDRNRAVDMRLEIEEEEEREREEAEKKKRQREMRGRNNGVLGKLTIKELKERAEHPELVEIWDTTAEDPDLLVYLKGFQGSVRVPQHWNSKRRYLQGKKGLEKPPYKLPHFIEETKIAEIRALLLEEESRMSLKQKQRRKIRPRLNRMDIDYQVLHDAFFVHSTKPSLTQFGDLYYEGKEFEFRYKSILPGRLSQRLRDALGMQPNWPPPWLIRMQKYGPPPSYPHLRVPGVNSQIPNGCEFGFRPGEWGKPPLDDEGKPIWGLLPPLDEDEPASLGHSKINTAKSHLHHSQADYWGEVELDLFDEAEGQDAERLSDEEHQIHSGDIRDVSGHGTNASKIVVNNPFLFTASGHVGRQDAECESYVSSTREQEQEQEQDQDQEQNQDLSKPLYTVIKQKEVPIDGNSIFPSSHVYSFK